MALRPEVYGFHLAELFNRFQSQDRALIADLESKLVQLAAESDLPSEFCDEYRTALRHAVDHGVPVPQLERETDAHVLLAIDLAKYRQELQPVGSNDWDMNAFFDFWETCQPLLSPAQQSLLRYWEVGRPLFGKKIETGWSYYGYLSRDEVIQTRRLLDALKNEHAAFAEEDYLDGFLVAWDEWLETIAAAGLDLWFWTY